MAEPTHHTPKLFLPRPLKTSRSCSEPSLLYSKDWYKTRKRVLGFGGTAPQTPNKIFGWGGLYLGTPCNACGTVSFCSFCSGDTQARERERSRKPWLVGPGEGIWGRQSRLGGLSAGVGHTGRGLGMSVSVMGDYKGSVGGPWGGLRGVCGCWGRGWVCWGVVIGGLRVSRGVEAVPPPSPTQDTPCTNSSWGELGSLLESPERLHWEQVRLHAPYGTALPGPLSPALY